MMANMNMNDLEQQKRLKLKNKENQVTILINLTQNKYGDATAKKLIVLKDIVNAI